MTIINGRMLFLPSKINKSKKLNIKNIAPSLFSVLSFFLSHSRITVIYKSTNNYPKMYGSLYSSSFLAFIFLLFIWFKSITTSSSLESDLVLFCSFLVWENAAPKAIPIPIPIPKLSVAAPIPMPIATPAKNFNSLLIQTKSTNNYPTKTDKCIT